jgi:hypothetical protein
MFTCESFRPDKSENLPKVGDMTFAEGWEMIETSQETINRRLSQVITEMMTIAELDSAAHRMARILAFLEYLEKKETKLSELLARRSPRRLTIDSFAPTLFEDVKQLYYAEVSGEYRLHLEKVIDE